MSTPQIITSRHVKPIPDDRFYFTTSCILGALNPSTETLITRVYDLLGLTWRIAPDRPDSQCTCCSGILSHGDVITFESTLLVVARLWAVAAELGFENITTACVTSFAIHTECLEMLHHEPGLQEKVDRWLHAACGRHLTVPRSVVHCSDVFYHHRAPIGAHLKHRLVDASTGRPLKVVDHVGCHYNKVFPEKAVGGSDYCDVLTALIREWGGAEVDYPERRHCCGMGFRQCMIRPNRGYSMACVLKKLQSMAPQEPDLILTNCPGCNQFLDREQHAVNAMTGSRYAIPVLSYAELTGLLLGWDPYEVVGIQSHTVPLEPLLTRMGIPHDPARAYTPTRLPRFGEGAHA